jgi:beta-phosphoglucomutase-like phosphatase (HAD superfamily)
MNRPSMSSVLPSLPFPTAVAILCDLDGVLVDSGDSIEVTWSAWARSHGIEPAVLHGRIHGRPAADVIREIAPELDAIAEAAVILTTHARAELGAADAIAGSVADALALLGFASER